MNFIETEAELAAIYGSPQLAATVKVSPVITPLYRAHIEAAPFCALASVGAEGLDCSPRGDAGQVVRVLDERTLAMPDRRGNNRIDTLRNIVRDPRVSLMFLTPQSATIIRVNGKARITADRALCEAFSKDDKLPRTVVLVFLGEVYFQCARALMRSGLWNFEGRDKPQLPSPGQILEEQSERSIKGAQYDEEWAGRAAKTMW